MYVNELRILATSVYVSTAASVVKMLIARSKNRSQYPAENENKKNKKLAL